MLIFLTENFLDHSAIFYNMNTVQEKLEKNVGKQAEISTIHEVYTGEIINKEDTIYIGTNPILEVHEKPKLGIPLSSGKIDYYMEDIKSVDILE